MSRQHQRRQHRVAYATTVRLHPVGRRRSEFIDGRIINLSRSGVLIESLQPCPVGTDLVCEIPLPGGDRRLPGRVARLQPVSPDAVALGIAFAPLPRPDAELLLEVVGDPGDEGTTRLVQVQFEGVREPLCSRALLTTQGIRLTTALPFLRLRSGVEVTFLSGETRLQSHGHVRDVQFQHMGPDGVPLVAVDVTLAADEPEDADSAAPAPTSTLEEFPLSPGAAFGSPRGQRAVPVAAGREPEVDPASTAAPDADGATSPDGVIVIGPTWRTHGDALVQAEAAPPETAPPEAAPPETDQALIPTPAVPAQAAEATVPQRKRAMSVAAAILAGAGVGVAIGGLLAVVARSGPAAPPAMVARAEPPAPRPPVSGPAVVTPTPPGPAVVTPAPPMITPVPAPAVVTPAPVAVAPPRPAPPPMPEPLPEGTPGPTVDTSGSETTALVPLAGSTARMTHFSLMHPRGLAVNLPLAQTVLAPGLHKVDRDGLRFVWIRDRREGGLQVRFIFTTPPPDERLLELEEDALRIRVRRHDQLATTPPPLVPQGNDNGDAGPAEGATVAGGPALP
jgi:hypothetical protein